MSLAILELAEQEGISSATLYNWRRQASARGQVLPSRSATPDQWATDADLNTYFTAHQY
ncbi:transposase [Modicisalibacter muralis]|uniref:transposase n=1 Tax=Modicisalibacter muralis TaxID=119000 RepID=UPI001587E69E|nr:transposase [Halomonas muralis]